MKKYLETAKTLFKAQLNYRFEMVAQMLFTVTKILFAYVLWGAVFGTRDVVAGFTFNAMLSYYIISSFVSQLDMSDSMGNEISARIRNGTFSKYMVIPVSVSGYFGAQTAGAAAFYLSSICCRPSYGCWFSASGCFSQGTPISSAWPCSCADLGLIFMIQLNFLLGILTFKFQDIWLFMMIKYSILAFATGTMLPLSMLPQGMVTLMRYLPFYYVTYLPSMLLIGRAGGEAATGVWIMLAWVAALIPINRWIYARLRVRYDGVGI